MKNKSRTKDILDAIDELFSDTSVSQSKTKEDLEEIIDECKMKILSLEG